MGRVRGAGPIVVALGAAALLVGLLGFSDTLNPLDAVLGRRAVVAVPDLTGRPQPGAEAEIRGIGLESEVRTSFSLTVARGTVIGQDPEPGSRIRQGSTVEIIVSRGENRIAMPDGVGRPLSDALVPLEDAGVDVTVERRPSETVADGLVISQEPGPGVQLTGDDDAALVVSDGPTAREIPDLAGRQLAGASYTLGAAGLVVGEVVEVDAAGVPVGAVVGTDPPAGRTVPRDTVLTVQISAGGAPAPVPDLVGTAGPAARDAATAAGFLPNLVSQNGSGVGGAVVSQDPAPGTPMRAGSVLTLVAGPGAGG
jgi:serine/threonine-protein kinase